MFLSGLNTNCVLPPPPHRIPTRVTLSPEVILNTGEPLSPEPTMFAELFVTSVWQISWTLEPDTFTVMHVPLTVPAVQPVVRPTLLIVPLKLVFASSCAVIVKFPATVSEPVLRPSVFAMMPLLDAVVELYRARDASALRHTLPAEHPGIPA